MRSNVSSVLLAATVLSATAGSGLAVETFYKGKSVNVIIGYTAGGTYDSTARLLTRYMPRHIPGNPTMIPQNMPGSGSIKAILHLYSVAPKDGSSLAMISRGYAIDPLFYPDKAKFDPRRFNPIGSTSTEVSVGVVWHTKPFNSIADLQTRELVLGATGPSDDTGRFPMILKRLTGAKIRLVQGYPGGNNITQAMEAGEVDGRFGWSWGSVKSRSKHWLDEKQIRILIQMALKRAPDLPDVPNIMEFAKTDLDRQALELMFSPQAAAWPLIAPPDVPMDRVTALRRAFDRTMSDPTFVAEAKKLRIDVEPVTGEEMVKLVERTASFDKSVIERAISLTKLE